MFAIMPDMQAPNLSVSLASINVDDTSSSDTACLPVYSMQYRRNSEYLTGDTLPLVVLQKSDIKSPNCSSGSCNCILMCFNVSCLPNKWLINVNDYNYNIYIRYP